MLMSIHVFSEYIYRIRKTGCDIISIDIIRSHEVISDIISNTEVLAFFIQVYICTIIYIM